MQALLRGIAHFWDPAKNPSIRYTPLAKRIFHRDRNYAIILGLLDSAARIGEMLSLKVDDYRAKERQIVIRESKGREPRTLPVSPEWIAALDVWMRQRTKVLKGQEDEGWLFISEFGGRLDEGRFLKALKKVTSDAGITESIGLAPRLAVAQIKRFDGLNVHQRSVDELRGACLRRGGSHSGDDFGVLAGSPRTRGGTGSFRHAGCCRSPD